MRRIEAASVIFTSAPQLPPKNCREHHIRHVIRRRPSSACCAGGPGSSAAANRAHAWWCSPSTRHWRPLVAAAAVHAVDDIVKRDARALVEAIDRSVWTWCTRRVLLAATLDCSTGRGVAVPLGGEALGAAA